jgi:hypothetical protein
LPRDRPTRRALRSGAGVLAAALLLAGAYGCGRAANRPGHGRSATTSSPKPAPELPALGLTEDNASLLGSPDGFSPAPAAFQAARTQLTALHPTYLRLLVDWAALQPRRGRPPALEAPVSGCAREIGPCGPYSGIGGELAAIASQQHATGAGGGFRVVIDVFGTPAWAARRGSGCETRGTAAFSRPLRPEAIADYRALIASLLQLGKRYGVALEWWSPWNEPNDPRFLSPQRASCAAGSPPVSADAYAQLARAMAAELRSADGEHHLVLGELNDLERDTPRSTSVAQFVGSLPPDVICLDGVWSIHAYARHAPAPASTDAVRALETALDARGACGREARIWVTEAGAGAPHPGRPRPADAVDQQASCRALAEQLQAWHSDPRVGAVFQYTFREDPAFPVGLASADLSHLYPTYRLWLAWSQLRVAGQSPPTPGAACA